MNAPNGKICFSVTNHSFCLAISSSAPARDSELRPAAFAASISRPRNTGQADTPAGISIWEYLRASSRFANVPQSCCFMSPGSSDRRRLIGATCSESKRAVASESSDFGQSNCATWSRRSQPHSSRTVTRTQIVRFTKTPVDRYKYPAQVTRQPPSPARISQTSLSMVARKSRCFLV